MSYDIFFVRRDPGQSFEDALDDLEDSFEGGDPGPLTDVELEQWEALLPRAREVLGLDVDVAEDEETRELIDPATGIELTLFTGEIEIHVPDHQVDGDAVELMAKVYELAQAVEDVTGLEGYDPQLGEPVSDQAGADTPTRRRWPDLGDPDDEDDGPRGAPPAARFEPPEPMPPDVPAAPRRWWELWKP